MAYRTYIRYHQKLDIYARSVTTNNAGQELASWALSQSDVPCILQPLSTERRVSPYNESVEEYGVIVPHSYASYFSYGYRIENIRDRYSNVLTAGPYEVVEIIRATGWNGKLSHISVTIRLAVELI